MIPAFPKIFHIGTKPAQRLFTGTVEITEKIDGSQFAFGKIDGVLYMRSKGVLIEDYEYRTGSDLFYPAIQHVMSIQDRLEDGLIYYGETLKVPKHNTLTYDRVPLNHFMLFGVKDTKVDVFFRSHDSLAQEARRLDVDVVPLLYRGRIDSKEELMEFMDKPSVLGGTNAEGIVVKNYDQPFLLGGDYIPLTSGKYVTEAFKEVHRTGWSKENTNGGKWMAFKEGYKTPARWDKAIQHLRDKGELTNEPKDIGRLMKEINLDIISEEKENIKDFLWNHFGKELLRVATSGFPEYYKQYLIDKGFEDANTNDDEGSSRIG